MGNRYGRNQKRKHREEIKKLASELQFSEMMRRGAEYRAETARNDALKYFAENTGLLKEAITRISYELGKAVGKELEPSARKLFEASMTEWRDNPIDFSMVDNSFQGRPFTTIRGEIKRLMYNIVIG